MNGKLKYTLSVIALSTLAVAAGAVYADQQSDNLGQGELTTIELLQLMDKDKDGKVSRQEFMNFMSAEFDRLDVNKDGKLDAAELSHLIHRVGHNPGYRR